MSEFSHLSVEDARSLIAARDPVIADIRDPQSFAMGHMPEAIALTNENLAQFIQDTKPDTPVIVVCYHGVSSQSAAQYISTQGFSEVYSLDGGFTAWAQYQPDLIEQG